MTTFNDLITDLASEKLLDEINILPIETAKNKSNSVFWGDPELPSIQLPEFLSISENYELKLPDFSVLKPENEILLENDQIKNVFPTTENTLTFQNTQNLIRYQARRHRTKRAVKGGKFCRACSVNVSVLSLHCQYCHQRVVSDLYYYSLIMLGFVIFTIITWMIVTSKSYN